jgi:hypothetical protein
MNDGSCATVILIASICRPPARRVDPFGDNLRMLDVVGRRIGAAAVIAASAVVFPRMLIIVAIVAPQLVGPLSPPLISAAVVSLAIASWCAWRSRNAGLSSTGQELATRNPLDLWFASKFGLLLALIMILSRAAKELLGNRGLIALSGISGLVDVDAITLSAASRFEQGQMKLPTAKIVILTGPIFWANWGERLIWHLELGKSRTLEGERFRVRVDDSRGQNAAGGCCNQSAIVRRRFELRAANRKFRRSSIHPAAYR